MKILFLSREGDVLSTSKHDTEPGADLPELIKHGGRYYVFNGEGPDPDD